MKNLIQKQIVDGDDVYIVDLCDEHKDMSDDKILEVIR